MIKEIKTDLEQKGLEPSFNMVSKPVICQISPCGGFPDRITYSAVYSLKSSLNILCDFSSQANIAIHFLKNKTTY